MSDFLVIVYYHLQQSIYLDNFQVELVIVQLESGKLDKMYYNYKLNKETIPKSLNYVTFPVAPSSDTLANFIRNESYRFTV